MWALSGAKANLHLHAFLLWASCLIHRYVNRLGLAPQTQRWCCDKNARIPTRQTNLKTVTQMACQGAGLPPKKWKRSWPASGQTWQPQARTLDRQAVSKSFYGSQGVSELQWSRQRLVFRLTLDTRTAAINQKKSVGISRLKRVSFRPPAAGLKVSVCSDRRDFHMVELRLEPNLSKKALCLSEQLLKHCRHVLWSG